MNRTLVIGAQRGIGQAIANQLHQDHNHEVIVTSRLYADLEKTGGHRWQVQCDLTDPSSIKELERQIRQQFNHIDWLINCAGVLHNNDFMPEKTFKQISQRRFDDSFQINCVGHLLLINQLHQSLIQAKQPMVVSLSARIGSIEDNHLGGWHAYRMSKAALNMGMKTTGIEWLRKHPHAKLMLLHPGTTDTDLSKPFQRNLPDGQLQTAEAVATKLINVINKHQHNKPTGTVFMDYNGATIPW